MNQVYIGSIIKALCETHPDADSAAIDSATEFSSIPGLDSMSLVVFQVQLAGLIGKKANDVLPIPDMTIAEYAEALESI